MKNKLTKYLVLTFGITWLCWFADALLVSLTPLANTDVLPMILFTLGGFGPTIAACLCLEGGFSRKKLWRFLVGEKKQGILCFGVLVALELLAFSLSCAGFIASIPQGFGPKAVVMAVVFLQSAVLYGGNEELGWRGTMQPVLEKRFSFPVATLMVGCVWVVWHIPLWFIPGDGHQSMSFVFFAGFGILLSFWLAAIYRTSKAVLPCMVFHGLTNTLMGVLLYDYKNAVFFTCIMGMTLASVLFATLYKPQSNTP